MAPYCSIVEGDGAQGHLSLSYCLENILQFNLWWQMEYQGLYFVITMARTLILYKKGLRFFRDN